MSTRCAWISGNKKERELTLTKIRTSIGACDEYTFGEETDYQTLESQVLTSDVFGAKRLIIMTGLPSFNGTRQTMVAHLKKLISAVPDDCLMVFYGIAPDDERAIFSHVSKEGKVFDFTDTIPFVDAEQLMMKLLAEAEKTYDEPMIGNLLRHTSTVDDKKNYTIDQIHVTTQKLLSYMGTRKVVTAEDIREIGTGGNTATVWQLFDAIDEKNYDKCQLLINRLVICEEQGDWASLCIRLIQTSLWRYKLLMFVKEAQASGKSDSEIVAEGISLQKLSYEGVGGNMKMREEKGGYSEKQIRSALGGGFMGTPLEKYSRGRLATILGFLQEAIEETRHVVSGDAGFHLMADLYLLLACGKIDDKRRRKVWEFFQYDNE